MEDNIKYQKLPRCVTASLKCGELTFQGAGKTKEEAVQVMWAQYNKYYKTNNKYE